MFKTIDPRGSIALARSAIAAHAMLLLMVSSLLSASCTGDTRSVSFDGPTMGTTYRVVLVGVADLDVDNLRADVTRTLLAINSAMSTYDSLSELSIINATRSNDWLAISPALEEVMLAARDVHQRSGGMFDVTVAPLVALWGFGVQKSERVPSAAAIAAALPRIGMQHLELDERGRLQKTRTDVLIDLSAIAKGYAVDALAVLVESFGCQNYLIDIGGELRLRGHNERGDDWRIGLERPAPGLRAIELSVALSDTGVATSGNYRNFFVVDGRRYGHTLDPRSGYPSATQIASVTVLSPRAMTADAWATAFMAMGFEEAMELAEREQIAVLFLLHDGNNFSQALSSQFKHQVTEANGRL